MTLGLTKQLAERLQLLFRTVTVEYQTRRKNRVDLLLQHTLCTHRRCGRANEANAQRTSEGALAVQFQILGPVRLQVDGHVAHVGATKVRSMLGILLLSPNTPVSVSTFEQRMWDEPAQATGQRLVKGRDLPPEPHKALQVYATRLRTALKKARSTATLITENRAYRLSLDPADVDYHRFRALAAAGRRAALRGAQDQARTSFAAAVDLWRGTPLADLTTSWAQAHRDILINRDLLPAYYGLFDSYLALGHYELVLEQLHPLLPEHDLDETLAGQWMRAVAAVDGPGTLPGFFRAFSERVRTVMDAEPGDQLVRLYTRLTQPQQPSPVPISSTEPLARLVPHQLPRPTPYFTGRRDTMAALDNLFLDGNAPVIAIDGPPGIGKSELVAQWASRLSFADGELFANLGGHGQTEPLEPAAVLASFLDALGVPPDRTPSLPQDRLTLLRQLLAGRRMLILLDNARDSDHVRPVVSAAGSCAVIITSRQQLTGLVHRDGAHRLTLPRLPSEDATALLRHRIGESRTAHDPQSVQNLASLCDGLPLGLRMAAEHVAARPDVPVRDLVSQLYRQRRILLDTGSHGDDETVTLRAVFSCSYEALPPDASRLFRMLGLSPGTDFSIPEAAALSALPTARAEQVLDVLLGANLVEQRTADRFRLHDLIHLFAVELVSEDDDETRKATVHRVLDWYLGTTINAARSVDPHRVEVPQLPLISGVEPQTFVDEQEALRWCVSERINLLETVRYAARHGFHEHTWRLVGEFDDLMHRYGKPSDLLSVHQVALESARAVNAKEGEAGLLNNLGFTYFYMKEYEKAAEQLGMARVVYRELGDVYGEAVSLTNIATTSAKLGDFNAVIDQYKEAIVLFDQVGNKVGRASAYHRLGDAHRAMGQLDTASECYQESLRLREELDHRGQADTLTALGELYLAQGDAIAAIGYCEKALIFQRRALDERRTAEALEALATAYSRITRHADAIPAATEAAQRYQAINEPRGQARSLCLLGELHQTIGEYPAARTHWKTALTLFRDLQDPQVAVVESHLARLDTA
jgi:tetratricopeptide (TPR) repeat protein